MAPVLDALKHDCEAKGVSVMKIDVSRPENRRYVTEYALRGVPTFIGWDERGTMQARLVGEQPPRVLVDTLSNLSGELCTTALDLDQPTPAEPAACGAALEGESQGCAL